MAPTNAATTASLSRKIACARINLARGRFLGLDLRRTRFWAVVLLPGLLLRSLIPVGFMPMFGPGLSLRLMLCPEYAPLPAAINSPAPPADSASTADTSMDMSDMDMSMEMQLADHEGQPVDRGRKRSDASVSAWTRRSTPLNGSLPGGRSDHQEHTLCPYAASAALAGSPTYSNLTAGKQAVTEFALLTPQIAYFRVAPRAQSARAPPLIRS